MVYWYGKQYDFAQLEHTYHLHSFLGKPFIIFYRDKKMHQSVQEGGDASYGGKLFPIQKTNRSL